MDKLVLEILVKEDEKKWKNSWELSQANNLDHLKVDGGLKSLEARNYLKLKPKKEKKYQLTKEGLEYATNGLPEYRIYEALLESPEKQLEKKVIQGKFGKLFKIGLQNGIKKYFTLNKTHLIAVKSDNKLEDDTLLILQKMKNSEFFDDSYKSISSLKELKKLKKRKLYTEKTLNYNIILKGEDFSNELKVLKVDLTMEDIIKETFKDKSNFKKLNFNAKGKVVENGGLHPLYKMRSEFRIILLEMGFEEMETNQYVESSFWNFDSLFQPQQHPARDSHDTFFIKNPEKTTYDSEKMKKYVETVKQYHEKGFKDGDEESYGWQYKWCIEESKKNILRTHTTSVSSRYLKQIADDYKKTGKFTPKKYFSIDRVFRNETLDATHLAEFHQVEGLIIDKNLGLPQLKSFIKDFFNKIGLTDTKFKPAYNPYTEPSMEIFVYHPLLKKMIEIGNSGIFRPEMLKPMGLPEDVSVIAWGLSLERPAMINFQCSNIRELLGYKVNFNSVKNSEIINF